MSGPITRATNPQKTSLQNQIAKFVAIALLVGTIILGIVAIVHAGDPNAFMSNVGIGGGIPMVIVPALVILASVYRHLKEKKCPSTPQN